CSKKYDVLAVASNALDGRRERSRSKYDERPVVETIHRREQLLDVIDRFETTDVDRQPFVLADASLAEPIAGGREDIWIGVCEELVDLHECGFCHITGVARDQIKLIDVCIESVVCLA